MSHRFTHLLDLHPESQHHFCMFVHIEEFVSQELKVDPAMLHECSKKFLCDNQFYSFLCDKRNCNLILSHVRLLPLLNEHS